MTNFDEIEIFLSNLRYIKENQNILDYNPLLEVEEKKKTLKPIELKTINMYSKIQQVHESVDKISETYTRSVNILNEKFAFYNDLFTKLELKNKKK